MAIIACVDTRLALVTLSSRGLLLDADPALFDWLGHAEDERVDRFEFQALLSVDSRTFYRTKWLPTITLERSISDVRLELVRRDGSLLTVTANARRCATEDGVIDEIALVIDQRSMTQDSSMSPTERANAV